MLCARSVAAVYASRRLMPRVFATLVIVVGLASPAFGHPLDLGFLRIDAREPTVRIELDLETSVAAGLVGVADGAAVPAQAEQLAAATYRS
jgi:hypothetical protein